MRGHLAEDLTGRRIGNLVVVGRAENRVTISNGKEHKQAIWYCQCDCGSPIKAIRASHLKSGKIISCGCIGQKHSRDAKIKHNGRHTRLYGVWCNMKNRCYNPNVRSYKNYGARGIKVCDEWRNDFGVFQKWAMENGYDPDAKFFDCTIDRINNDGNYEPDNCRFVDMKTQAHNKTHKEVEARCSTKQSSRDD